MDTGQGHRARHNFFEDNKLFLPDRIAGSNTNLGVAKLCHSNFIWMDKLQLVLTCYMPFYAFIPHIIWPLKHETWGDHENW